MSETSFPVNDLLRRKLQTGLTVVSLTGSVASTLFLLLFSYRIGLSATSAAEDTMTVGLSAVFSQLILFVGILVFVVGAVLTSFIVFLMTSQRTRDFGLIKAAGCPNSLVFGYFMAELLIVTFFGCVLGVLLGFVADIAASNLSGFSVYQNPANIWFAPLVFAAFFILALAFGTKPILNAARLSPMKAISSAHYFGLTAAGKLKPFSASRLTGKIAMRSLSRRPTATLRIALLLSTVFILLTVSIAGSIIAKDTTMSWIERTTGNNGMAIAHEEMAAQYELLQSKFFGAGDNGAVFDYLSEEFALSNGTIQHLSSLPIVNKVDSRLVLNQHVYEISNFSIDPETLATYPVGDHREGDSLVIGVDPAELTGSWFLQGRFLENDNSWEAVVGDSIARKMFSQPLVQSLRFQNQTFAIVGVCFDPINNGRVIYVPIKKLHQTMGTSAANIVFVELTPSLDRAAAVQQLTERIGSINQNLTLIDLNRVVHQSLVFLDSAWSIIMLLPLFTLASAAVCLVAYVMLSINEQRQEFAILRAIGAKPRTIVNIVAFQSAVILASSLALGLSFGVIGTLIILVPEPVVTNFTILQIAAWLTIAATGMFILSLTPRIEIRSNSAAKNHYLGGRTLFENTPKPQVGRVAGL